MPLKGGGGRRLMAYTILNFHFDYLHTSLGMDKMSGKKDDVAFLQDFTEDLFLARVFFKVLDLRSFSWIGRWSGFLPVCQLLAEAPPAPQQFSQQTDASSKELEGPRGTRDTSSTQEWWRRPSR